MKIVAIKQTASGHNIHFISDEYSEYTLDDLLTQGNKVALENVQVFTPRSGKKSVRLKADKDKSNNLETVAITCNDKDYLLFDRQYIYLKTQNGRIKRKWAAFSGDLLSTIKDQKKSDFGPLPEGNYIARFDKTIDYASAESLWDTVKWLIKKPSWGLIVTPLEADAKTNTYGRGSFYIHGGEAPGSKGCIDLADQNASFHTVMRLYHRNLKVVVKY